MSLREKLILVGFGAAICGGVAGGVIIVFSRPGAQAPAVSAAALPNTTPSLAVNPKPGALPALGGGAQQSPTAVAAPTSSTVDAILAGDLAIRGAADPRYETYRRALESAAPAIRAMSPEAQEREVVRIKESIFGAKQSR